MKTTGATAVIEACLKAERTGRRADKAHATRILDRYVTNRVAEGFGEKGVRAAIKAHVTRRL